MPSRLENLPAELLNNILSDVGGSSLYEDYCKESTTYHALCLTSKKLGEAATPYLYADVRLKLDAFKHDQPRFRQLARTLCESPELADHVQMFEAQPCKVKTKQAPSSKELALFMHHLEPLLIDPAHNRLATALIRGCHTAELIVVLTLCKQIRTIRLSIHDNKTNTRCLDNQAVCGYCPDVVSSLFAVDANGRPSFEIDKLRHAAVLGNRNLLHDSDTSPMVLSHFLAAPLLEEITCFGFGSVSFAYPWVCAPAASKVQSLVLRSSNLATADAVMILESCEALREFEISWTPFRAVTEHNVDTAALSAALSRHSPTLERLVILDLTCRGETFGGQAALTGLQHYHKLRKLEIDEAILIGDVLAGVIWNSYSLHNKLPPKLTELNIHTFCKFRYLGNILAACSNYEGHALECLDVTFAIDDELGNNYPDLFTYVHNTDYRSWYLEGEWSLSGSRALFRCEARPIGPVLKALAENISESGVEHLLRLQLPETAEEGTGNEGQEGNGLDIVAGVEQLTQDGGS